MESFNKKIEDLIVELNQNKEKINLDHIDSSMLQEKVSAKTALAYFLMECAWPVSFYFTYSHCANILKNIYFYSSSYAQNLSSIRSARV